MTIFSVLLALGAVLGLIWIILESPKDEQQPSLFAGTGALFLTLVGGRIAYVAVNWEYFQDFLIEIPQVWLGGFAWPGALAGGILGALIAAWLYDMPVGILVDCLLPLLASLSVAAWLGCWMTGCGYGPEMVWGLPAKDEWGIWKTRFPLQLICTAMIVASFWGIEWIRYRKEDLSPGLAASFGLGALSLILLGASLLRNDHYPIYRGLRLETWAALIFLGICSIFILSIVLLRNKEKTKHRE